MGNRITFSCEELALFVFKRSIGEFPTDSDYDLFKYHKDNCKLESYNNRQIDESVFKELLTENVKKYGTVKRYFYNILNKKSIRRPDYSDLYSFFKTFRLEEDWQFIQLLIKVEFERFLIDQSALESEELDKDNSANEFPYHFITDIKNIDLKNQEEHDFFKNLIASFKLYREETIRDKIDKLNKKYSANLSKEFIGHIMKNNEFLYSIWQRKSIDDNIKNLNSLKHNLQLLTEKLAEEIFLRFNIELKIENLTFKNWQKKFEITDYIKKTKINRRKIELLKGDREILLSDFTEEINKYKEELNIENKDLITGENKNYFEMQLLKSDKTREPEPNYKEVFKESFIKVFFMCAPDTFVGNNIPEHLKKDLEKIYRDAINVHKYKNSIMHNTVQISEIEILLDAAIKIFKENNLKLPQKVIESNLPLHYQINNLHEKIKIVQENIEETENDQYNFNIIQKELKLSNYENLKKCDVEEKSYLLIKTEWEDFKKGRPDLD